MRIPSGVTDQVIYFVAVDSTDLKTRETGLSSFTVYRTRDGSTAAAYTTPTVTEVDATNMPGVYKLLLDEDTTIASGNQSEEYCVHITQASMAPVTRTIELYRPSVTAGETLTVSSGVGSANAVQLSGDSTAADNAEAFFDGTGYAGTNNVIPTVSSVTAIATGGITAASIAADAIGASELAADAVAEIADAVWNEDATGHQTAGTFGQAIGDPGANTETIYDAVVTDAAGTNIAADIIALDAVADAVLVDTAEIGAAGAGLTEAGGTGDQLSAIPWNASWDAEVQSEVNDGLVAVGLDHLVGASVAGTDVTDNSIIAKLVSSSATADWDTFVNTTDSLQATRDHIGDGTNLTEAGGDGDHLTEAGGDGDHLTEAGGDGDHLTEAGGTGDQLTALATAAALATTDSVADAVKVVTDALTSAGAAKLALSAAGIISGTASGTHSTTTVQSDLTGYLDDELINGVIIFTSGTAAGQRALITDYAATNGTVTFSGGITTAPVDADTFVIV